MLLGWSPVTRAVLGLKQRSDSTTHESEDGSRAVVIKEGIAATVFDYASQHRYLDQVTRLDQKLLDTIPMVIGPTELSVRTAADWEQAILAGFEMFRQLRSSGGGRVHFDADAQTLRFEPLT